MQLSMPFLQDVKLDRIDIDVRHVRVCDTEQAAMRLCISRSRVLMRQRDLAESLGCKIGTLNTILNSDLNERQRYMSRAKQERLQMLCGNNAVNQWADLYSRGLLACQESGESAQERLYTRRDTHRKG